VPEEDKIHIRNPRFKDEPSNQEKIAEKIKEHEDAESGD
tara:strand:+ start:11 stop:127 length:117 start_codon:yes stop_codon:yes gene_type:complete